MKNTASIWNDEAMISILLEECDSLETGPSKFTNRMYLWKEFIAGFTRQRSESIFNEESLEQKFTRGNLRLPLLNRAIKALCQEGIIKPVKSPGWLYQLMNFFFYTDIDQLYFNVEAVAQTCRAVQVIIKTLHSRHLKVTYEHMWDVCYETCEGNEHLFKLVLERIPDISVQGDMITIKSKSHVFSGELCVKLDEALDELRLTVLKIHEMTTMRQLNEYTCNEQTFKHKRRTQKNDKFTPAKQAPIQTELLPMLLSRLRQIQTELENQKSSSDPLVVVKVNAALETIAAAKTVIEIVEKLEVRSGQEYQEEHYELLEFGNADRY
ncbi:uncharacterized protein LOC111247706 isoform X1 [Varroa destructor]|uniref:Uncharacterized protein n=1 Tax=Varroa destructor TaxID=109461 RepID=A0A7M7JN63_VARDE|nr:uncharacterized protein LOC111247706 isoform X1 [Varroa destructor]